ncbi:MAG: MerR family transcriptional regulator [Bdellovibrio sp.]|nr:MerR family transcriptional regulator [Bdellovibrio sp.]
MVRESCRFLSNKGSEAARSYLPEKSAFKLEEVCDLTGLKPYTLKFWESEFPQIRPIISSFGKKLYEERDLNVITLIKKMLFEEKLSLEDAKAAINERLQACENLVSLSEDTDQTCELISGLQDCPNDLAESPLPDMWSASAAREIIRRELQELLAEIKTLQSSY